MIFIINCTTNKKNIKTSNLDLWGF